jgi:toxin ParE1/3/4
VSYRLHPEAALEHEEQSAYYEGHSAGLGQRYHGAMLQAVSLAIEAPHRFKVARPPDIRQVRLLGFPFTVIYRESNSIVQVLAIAHHRRHPDYWLRRV